MFKKELDPEDFYYSPEGYIIFTEKYHLKRGYCCKNGCKHCPYGYNKKTGKFENEKKEQALINLCFLIQFIFRYLIEINYLFC